MNGSLSMHSIQLLPMMTLLKLGRLRFRDTASRSASCESVKARLSVSINQLPCKTWLLSVACAGLPPPLLYPLLLSRSRQTRCSTNLKNNQINSNPNSNTQQHTATYTLHKQRNKFSVKMINTINHCQMCQVAAITADMATTRAGTWSCPKQICYKGNPTTRIKHHHRRNKDQSRNNQWMEHYNTC